MPDANQGVVINTTPLIALSVATGSIDILRALYSRVIVTQEVQQEILDGGRHAPGVDEFLTSASTETPWILKLLQCRKAASSGDA